MFLLRYVTLKSYYFVLIHHQCTLNRNGFKNNKIYPTKKREKENISQQKKRNNQIQIKKEYISKSLSNLVI